MMLYEGEYWNIFKWCSRDTFQGMFKGGINDHLCREMGWWLIWKIDILETKNKATGQITRHRHLTARTVWEDNPLQPYEIIAPI